jgi:hypothetical protein
MKPLEPVGDAVPSRQIQVTSLSSFERFRSAAHSALDSVRRTGQTCSISWRPIAFSEICARPPLRRGVPGPGFGASFALSRRRGHRHASLPSTAAVARVGVHHCTRGKRLTSRFWDDIPADSVFIRGGVRDSSRALRIISPPTPLHASTWVLHRLNKHEESVGTRFAFPCVNSMCSWRVRHVRTTI